MYFFHVGVQVSGVSKRGATVDPRLKILVIVYTLMKKGSLAAFLIYARIYTHSNE